MFDQRTHIVAIHGVGDATPGSVIKHLSRVIDQKFRRDSLVVQGSSYATMRGRSRLYEVNWSDVQRPTSGSIGVLRHLLFLVFAMVFIGDCWQGANERSRVVTRAYRWFFEHVFFWAIVIPPFSLLLTCQTGAARIAIVTLIVLAVFATALMIRRLKTPAIAGVVCGIVLSGAGLLTLAAGIGIPPAVLAKSYCVCQAVIAILLVFSAVEIIFLNQGTWHTRLARLAFLYFPLLFVATLGPALLAASTLLLPVDSPNNNLSAVQKWEEQFLTGFGPWFPGDFLSYDFVISECLMTLTVSAIPIFALVGALLYFRFKTGEFARSWLLALLIAAPLLLISNSVLYVLLGLGVIDDLVLPAVFSESANGDDPQVLETYSYSSLRVIPVIPFLIGPLAIILDIVGDVVFYVLPESHPYSNRALTKRRLRRLVEAIDDSLDKYFVIGHSQGTVIAADALSELPDPRVTFVTMGSPIGSLYESFLDVHPGAGLRLGVHLKSWINVFRDGDYVGGRISRLDEQDHEWVVNVPLGPGGHTYYWDDQLVWTRCAEAATT